MIFCDHVSARWRMWGLSAGLWTLLWCGLPGTEPGALSVRAAFAQDEGLEDYKLAVGHYNANRWKFAAEAFQKFVKKYPQHRKAENARFYWGLALFNLEDYKAARDTLRSFLKDYPKSSDAVAAQYWIGNCSFFLDDWSSAAGELAQFVARSPEDPLLEHALPYLGEAQLKLKKYDLARKTFEQSLKSHPEGALVEDAKFGLARCLEMLKQPNDALKIYLELAAKKSGTRGADALFNMGALYYDDEQYTAALQAYEKLEKTYPSHALVTMARLNQGFALYQLQEYRKALPLFEKAAGDPKLAADATWWKGLCQKSLGNHADAATTLQAGYDKYRDLPIAERYLFHWADVEQRQAHHDEAQKLYLELLTRWPKSEFAGESLHAASLAALNAGKLTEVEQLLARFDKDFAGHKLRYRHEIVRGRLQLAKNDTTGALKSFQAVLSQSDLDSTKAQARYYYAAAAQKLEQHAAVLDVTAPLVEELDKQKSATEFHPVYVVRGLSQMALAKKTATDKAADKLAHFQAAIDSAQRYLQLAPQGDWADRALAMRAAALAHTGNKPGAIADIQTLKKSFPQSAELERLLLELGEVAFSNKDWDWAESLFTDLTARPKSSPYRAQAFVELGWTLHQQQKFTAASEAFGKLVEHYPTDPLVPEAAFMRGRALQDAAEKLRQTDKWPAALVAYQEAFKFPGTNENTRLAGLQAARLQARQKKWDEADQLYDELLKRFPKHRESDATLNEWATIHYDANHYEKADELYRRLVKSYPSSPLAAAAKFYLAESDLLSGKLDAAKTQFEALAKLEKLAGDLRERSQYQIVHIEFESKQWDDVKKSAQVLLDKYPESIYRHEVHYYWAEAAFQLKDYKATLEHLQLLREDREKSEVKRATWFPRVFVLLAETCFRQKQYDQVFATADEFRKWDPQSKLLYQVEEIVGRTYKAQAKFDEARSAYAKVLADPHGKQTETAAKSQFHIAESYMSQENYMDALQEYLKVDILYKHPEWQAPALLQAGKCYEALKDWKEASRTYQQLLKNFPTSEFAQPAKERLAVTIKKS